MQKTHHHHHHIITGFIIRYIPRNQAEIGAKISEQVADSSGEGQHTQGLLMQEEKLMNCDWLKLDRSLANGIKKLYKYVSETRFFMVISVYYLGTYLNKCCIMNVG